MEGRDCEPGVKEGKGELVIQGLLRNKVAERS